MLLKFPLPLQRRLKLLLDDEDLTLQFQQLLDHGVLTDTGPGARGRQTRSWSRALAQHSAQQVRAAVGRGHRGELFLQQWERVRFVPRAGRWLSGVWGRTLQIVLRLLCQDSASVAVGGV